MKSKNYNIQASRHIRNLRKNQFQSPILCGGGTFPFSYPIPFYFINSISYLSQLGGGI